MGVGCVRFSGDAEFLVFSLSGWGGGLVECRGDSNMMVNLGEIAIMIFFRCV